MANEPALAPTAPTETAAPAASSPAPAPAPTPAPSTATTASERLFERMATEPPAKKMSWEDIQNTMNGTPPAAATPPATVPQPNSGGQPAEGAKVGVGTPPPAQPASGTTPQPAQSGVPSAEDQLKADLAARDAYIQQLIQAGANPPAGQPAAQPAAPAAPVDDIPAHMYQLPQEVIAGMRSEDPAEASKALSTYTSLVTRTIHKQLREEYTKKIADLTTAIPQMVNKIIQHQTETKAIFEDFYGENKDLNKPELYPVILNTAMALMKETKATSWSPAFKAALAQRVRGILGVAQAQPATPPTPLPRQPAMMGTGARPAAEPATQADRMAEDILGTLRSGF